MTYSLLPENASKLERAFERAFLDLLGEIEAPFPGLLNPQQTPAEFLPYLANDRGVAEWESAAADDEKRKTVAAAWPTQRLAGTGKALASALASLNFSTTLVPWQEDSPRGQPFTLRIEARSEETIDEVKTARLFQRIAGAKAERDTLTLRMLREASMPLYFATATAQGNHMRMGPRPAMPSSEANQLTLATAQHAAGRYRISPWRLRLAVGDSATAHATVYHDYRHITVRG